MTKEKYMALADLQTVWNNSMKPYIQQQDGTKMDNIVWVTELPTASASTMNKIYAVGPAVESRNTVYGSPGIIGSGGSVGLFDTDYEFFVTRKHTTMVTFLPSNQTISSDNYRWEKVAFKISGTNEHLVSIDSSGNPIDSGKSISDFAAASHTHSQYLTEHQDISGKADKSETYTKAETDSKIESRELLPVNIATLTPSSTFVKNSVVGINGVLYRATQATGNLPCTMVTSGGSFVTNTVNGKTSFTVSDPTPNEGWEIWSDASIEYWIQQLNALIAAKASVSDVMAATVSYGGTAFTVQQLLTEVAKLVGKTVVTQ